MENFNQQINQNQGITPEAPNSLAVMILGIVSIVFSCGYGIGFIPAIISLVLSSDAHKQLKNNPMAYEATSAKNIKVGRTCAFIGIGLSIFLFLILVFIIGAAAVMNGFH